MNIWDILIISGIVFITVVTIRGTFGRKSRRMSCGGSCSNCSGCDLCAGGRK